MNINCNSSGCPTHGPHLILHHNENSEFTTPTRIFAVSSVLESFKDLTTTVTTTMTTANTSTNSLTKLPGNQLPTTYELRLEPIAPSDITLPATTDHKGGLGGNDGDGGGDVSGGFDENNEQLKNTKTISWIPVSILTDNITATPIHQSDYNM
ncbi:unnamed protein product [Trichobilharzia regenti]|nr:unnamed protein product [Trichobilharzia regenti]